MTIYYTYLYFDPSTSQHIYVGKGKEKRAYEHLSRCANKTFRWRLNKMAEKEVAPEIRLYPQETEQGAHELEIFLISLIGRRDQNKGRLLNHTDGGDGASNPCKESIEKRVSKMKGQKRSPEFCALISKLKKGKKRGAPWNKGITGYKVGPRKKQSKPAWNKGLPSPLKGTTIPQERKDRIASSKLGKKRGPYKNSRIP